MASTLAPTSASAKFESPAPAWDAEAADTALSTTNYVVNSGVIARAFRVGTVAGNVTIVTPAGNSVTIPSVQVGETIAVCFTQITKASTTATGITVFS